MARVFLIPFVFIGSVYLCVTLINGVFADEAARSSKVAVLQEGKPGQSPAAAGASVHSAKGALTGSVAEQVGPRLNGQILPGEQRDYRRELQYDASILEIRSQLHGIARPQQNAMMSSLVPGRLMTIHVAEGTRVASGDKVVSLDDRLAQAQLEAAQIEAARVGLLQRSEQVFRQAERRLKRLEQASLKSATAGFEIEESRSQMEQAQADYLAAKEAQAVAAANLKLAEEQLRRNSLFAPFDGIVVQIHQKAGATVDPSLPLVTLANLRTLEVEMYVPVDRFGALQVGGNVLVRASAPVNRELSATVQSVSPVIDSASNTFRCVLLIDNSDAKLPAGFSVTLSKETASTTDVAARRLRVDDPAYSSSN